MESTSAAEYLQLDKPKVYAPFGEKEAGIEEYLCPDNVHISCVMKHRFSDFIVNEIDEHGKVIWFTPETDLQKWKRVNIQEQISASSSKPPEQAAEEEEEKKDSTPAIALDAENLA